jgi:hypothetical protein
MILAALALAPSAAFSALVTFDDEPTFLASSGPVVVEGFETSTGSNISSLTTPNFVLTHSQTFSVLSSPSVYGTFAIDGTHFLEESLALVVNEMRFDGFTSPLTSFGLYVTDFGDNGAQPLTMTINGATTFTIAAQPRPNGNLLFFGVVASGGDQITKVVLASDDAIGIDKVSLSPVPEPGSLLMAAMAVAMGAICCLRKRRSK